MIMIAFDAFGVLYPLPKFHRRMSRVFYLFRHPIKKQANLFITNPSSKSPNLNTVECFGKGAF
jgi:hypothetical protein